MLHRHADWNCRVLSLLAIAIVACNSDDSVNVPSDSGTLEITTTTTGTEIDPDGYTVQIDAQDAGTVGASATMQTDLPPGDHIVQLTGLAANCTVSGENPRTASVAAGATISLSFAVSCGAGTGSGGLQVSSNTTGPAPDADGYSITLDGADRGPIGTTAGVTLDGIAPGEHEVGLSGVAGNCQVEGDNPRSVTIATGASASVSFSVICAAPPANAGSVRITTATTGADLDPNGYRITVDGGAAQPIGVNAATTVTNVAAGSHSVRLFGLSQNCSVQGSNPQSIAVTAGATAELSFSVSCGPTSGTVEIRTATTGASPDPDGYTVSLDGGATQPIGVNATIQLVGVAAGAHQLALAGLASNCSVQGDNPRAVNVAIGAPVTVDFAVSCPATSQSWALMTSGTTKNLRYVWGSSATNVFAAGENDCNTSHCGEMSILHNDGSGWTTQYTNAGGVLGLWAAPDGQAFALAEGDQPGPILHYNGQQWDRMAAQPPSPPDPNSQDITLRTIWGTSATDVFAAGSWFDGLQVHGYVAHYDGHQWSPMDLGGADDISLMDIWGSSATDVYAVGNYSPEDAEPSDERAIILHYNGQSWSEVVRQGGLALAHLWGSSGADVYATGSSGANGAVWHYNGSGWSAIQFPTTSPLGSIWGSSSSDIYVLNREAGKIWHYDGNSWKQIDTGSSKGLADIWGSSASDVFAVGADGTILKGP